VKRRSKSMASTAVNGLKPWRLTQTPYKPSIA
jgi:hypothetical protein